MLLITLMEKRFGFCRLLFLSAWPNIVLFCEQDGELLTGELGSAEINVVHKQRCCNKAKHRSFIDAK